MFSLFTTTTTCLFLGGALLVILAYSQVNAVAPTIDYSHNMRILKVPKSVRPGELIYRLKGSDGDPNSRLSFGVSGIEGRALLDVVQVEGSWNEADVYLRSPLLPADPLLQQQQQFAYSSSNPLPQYNLTVYVSDGNKTTQVESTLIVTNDDDVDDVDLQTAANWYQLPAPISISQLGGNNRTTSGSGGDFANSGRILPGVVNATSGRHHQVQLSPFLRPRHVFNAPEDTAPGESLGSLSVRESEKSELPVRFELRGRGSEHFTLRYVFGPRGQSRGELQLVHKLDYERQNLYSLKVLALNAWTNGKYDTRNVATLDIVITVGDVQDTAPQWRQLVPTLRVANNARAGDLVTRVQAEDGDQGDQRPLGYALDAGSPLASYFSIDKSTGDIRLARAANELALLTTTQGGGVGGEAAHMLVVFASELPDTSSYEHLWPPMFARAELPLQLVDVINEPPRLVGGWQTRAPSSSVQTLHGYVYEPLSWYSQQQASSSGQDDSSAPPTSERHESHQQRLVVQWYVNVSSTGLQNAGDLDDSITGPRPPLIIDLGQGANGTFELALEGPDAHLFELEPAHPVQKLSTFSLFVTQHALANNKTQFDFDHQQLNGGGGGGESRVFQLELVARDFGSPARLSSRAHLSIELLDLNDNAPQFDSDLYVFSVYENAPAGQVLGSIRARDPDARHQHQSTSHAGIPRVRYSSLTGRDSHLFKLDPDTGLVSLAGALDRERQDLYLLLAEARDSTGGPWANYTKLMINVLDVNDNAPVFSQSHYDAVLQADGSFVQPLIVRASDADESQSANSQVAYEIIAGNQNERFTIDSLSGAIYLTGFAAPPPASSSQLHYPPSTRSPTLSPLPPILNEPIVPYDQQPLRRQQLDAHGKIKPAHEVEEATTSGFYSTRSAAGRLSWPRSAPEMDDTPLSVFQQLPGSLDMLLNVDSTSTSGGEPSTTGPRARSVGPGDTATSATPPLVTASRVHGGGDSGDSFDALKVAPLTTLVVRAHDFGIPLRSATCKVNIYNQALLSRPVSVILNGTAEQLDARRELIERAFGSLTASRAQIESIDALSDSSSISVARIRLSIPASHSLIDLTDLSSLMNALDYKPTTGSGLTFDQFKQQATHYIAAGDRLYPVHSATPTAATGPTTSGPTTSSNITNGFYTDFNQFTAAFDSNMLERKLLFYIIIVGICILALLVIWMIYFCCRETDHQHHQVDRKFDKAYHQHHQRRHSSTSSGGGDSLADRKRRNNQQKQKSVSKTHLIDAGGEDIGQTGGGFEATPTSMKTAAQQQAVTHVKTPIGSAIENNLSKKQPSPFHLQAPGDQTASKGPSDHFSMYNGQVWFDQGGLRVNNRRPGPPSISTTTLGTGTGTGERRASSAPSAGNSLDSSLHAVMANGSGNYVTLGPGNQGRFFPNTIGYMDNLASLDSATGSVNGGGRGRLLNGTRRGHRRKVVPMALLNPDELPPADSRHHQLTGSGPTSTGSALVLVPANSLALAKDLRHAHKRGHARPQTSASLSSSCTSSSSSTSSRSSATTRVGGGPQPEVQLDSDQELLGFDSTGTPIIATHTRPASDRPVSVLSTSGTPTPAAPVEELKEAAPGGATSVAATKEVETKQRDEQTGEKSVANQESPLIVEVKKEGGQVNEASEQTATTTNARNSLDLMSELNERVKLRSLRRQSAGSGESIKGVQVTTTTNETNTEEGAERRRCSRDDSLVSCASSQETTIAARPSSGANGSATTTLTRSMKNGELLEKQSIFAMTYSGLATDKLPG